MTQPLWASVYLFVRGFGLVISKAGGFKHEPAVHLPHPNCEIVCTHTALWGREFTALMSFCKGSNDAEKVSAAAECSLPDPVMQVELSPAYRTITRKHWGKVYLAILEKGEDMNATWMLWRESD